MPSSRTKLKQYGVRVNGVLIRKSFSSALEARKWQRAQKDLQDQIRAGSKKHLAPTLLSIHAADFLRARKDMASFGHQETWMGKYILSRPKFQKVLLHEITRSEWKEVFGPYGELVVIHRLSPGTHNRIRAMVHKMYEDAIRDFEPSRASENPIHSIPELEEVTKAPQVLADKEEIGRYIAAAYQEKQYPCWGAYVAIKLNTGLRMQNIIPLRWKDYDGSRLKVREKFVRRKGFTGFLPGSKSDGSERMVGVNEALKTALEDWRKVTTHAKPEDHIISLPDGSYLSQKMIWFANKRTCERAKVPYLSEHKLRHSYATHYLAAGGSIHDLKQNLFHSTVTTTEIYSHALQSELERRAGVFQAVPTPKKPETK